MEILSEIRHAAISFLGIDQEELETQKYIRGCEGAARHKKLSSDYHITHGCYVTEWIQSNYFQYAVAPVESLYKFRTLDIQSYVKDVQA